MRPGTRRATRSSFRIVPRPRVARRPPLETVLLRQSGPARSPRTPCAKNRSPPTRPSRALDRFGLVDQGPSSRQPGRRRKEPSIGSAERRRVAHHGVVREDGCAHLRRPIANPDGVERHALARLMRNASVEEGDEVAVRGRPASACAAWPRGPCSSDSARTCARRNRGSPRCPVEENPGITASTQPHTSADEIAMVGALSCRTPRAPCSCEPRCPLPCVLQDQAGRRLRRHHHGQTEVDHPPRLAG